jgi:hypothetical protein
MIYVIGAEPYIYIAGSIETNDDNMVCVTMAAPVPGGPCTRQTCVSPFSVDLENNK